MLRKVLTAAAAVLACGPVAQAQQVSGQAAAEKYLVTRLNQIRAQGVTCPGSGQRPVSAALTPSTAHAQAAALQARYMGATGRVTHTGPGGSSARVRAASTGVRAVSVTEIIYLGGGLNPEKAIQWWLHSPVHCYWMTEGRYSLAGASIVQGARGTAYVMVLSSGR